MRVSDFDFDLPPRFIAQRPAAPRDSARLLAVGREFRDLDIVDLPKFLNPGDVPEFFYLSHYAWHGAFRAQYL